MKKLLIKTDFIFNKYNKIIYINIKKKKKIKNKKTKIKFFTNNKKKIK